MALLILCAPVCATSRFARLDAPALAEVSRLRQGCGATNKVRELTSSSSLKLGSASASRIADSSPVMLNQGFWNIPSPKWIEASV